MAGQTPLSNMAARTLMIATAMRNNYTNPVQAFNPTGAMTFAQPNVGLARFFRVHFQGNVQAGTADAATGVRFPFSLISSAQFVDPSNQTRMNVKPWHAHRLSVVKRPSWFFDTYGGLQNAAGGVAGYFNNYNLINTPVPGTVLDFDSGSPTVVKGFFDLPVTLSHNDLRGTLRLDVPNGQTQIILQPSATLSSLTAGVDVPFTLQAGSTIDFSNLQVKIDYYYFDPVAVQVNPGEVPQIPWPVDDMHYVHELLSSVATGIVAGQEYLWPLGTNREYFRLFHWFNNAGAIEDFSTGNFTQRKFLLNANTPKGIEDIQEYLSWYFEQHGVLPMDQEIYWNFYRRPWDSSQYGQLQTALQVASGATINAGAFLEIMRETLYMQL